MDEYFHGWYFFKKPLEDTIKFSGGTIYLGKGWPRLRWIGTFPFLGWENILYSDNLNWNFCGNFDYDFVVFITKFSEITRISFILILILYNILGYWSLFFLLEGKHISEFIKFVKTCDENLTDCREWYHLILELLSYGTLWIELW